MRATLIYNPHAAGTNTMSSDKLLELLAGVGFEAVHPFTEDEDDLETVLADPGDLVVVAGGDGTVRNVALRLRGRGVPLAIVPLGTANNIAHSLDLTAPTSELVTGLAHPVRHAFDLGRITAPWGEEYFLEGCGLGLFACTMARYDPDEGKNIMRALKSTLDTLSDYQPSPWQVRLDGEDLSGSYLLLEALNTRQVGPRLLLAPEADTGDGQLELVLVEEDTRVGLGAYLRNLIGGDLEHLQNVTVRRGHCLEIQWDGAPFHFDDRIRPDPSPDGARDGALERTEVQGGELRVDIEQGALELWLPQGSRERRD